MVTNARFQGIWLSVALVRLLLAAYKRRLRSIVEAAPAWMPERILDASDRIGNHHAALWLSENRVRRTDPQPALYGIMNPSA